MPASAQQIMEGTGEVRNLDVKRNGQNVSVNMDIDISKLEIGADETLILVPTIENGSKTLELPGVEIMGRRAYIYFLRNGEQTATSDPFYAERVAKRAERKAGQKQLVSYSSDVAFEEWMRGSTISVKESSCGCSATPIALGDNAIGAFGHEIYRPQYVLSFIEPEPEPIKMRAESLTAYINFYVDKYDIIEDYKNNAAELASMINSIDKVKDDANDEMGLEEKHVDECVIANNGVIYILNNVFGPADYRAVHAPSLVFDNMLMIRNCISQLRYDYYLKAMDAEYSFIIPDDKYFVYHDPASMTPTSTEPTVYAFRYDKLRPKGTGKTDELWAEKYKFNTTTYEITDTLTPSNAYSVATKGNGFGDTFMKNRMTDIMEYLIIVHDEGDGIIRADGSLNPKKYYQTKGYGTMKIDTSDPEAIKFYGGEQIENGTAITIASQHEQENGYAYCTVPYGDVSPMRKASAIPTPPTKSVYSNILANSAEEDDIFHEFFELCMPDSLEATLTVMFPKAKANAIKNDSMRLYSTFFSSSDGKLVNIVPFFNTFHYTVYVPSNESIKKEIENGLPTWDVIGNVVNENPEKAASMLRLLNNFVRYHFQDNSVYVDNVPFSIPSPEGGKYTEANFATAVINSKTGRFYETTVKSADDNSTVLVTDQMGNTAKILKAGEEGKTWNVMARDIEYTAKNKGNIATSSYSVIQPIDRALLNEGLFGYDGRFRRYSADGELVDVMTVEGIDGSVTVDGEKPYLVAHVGEYEMKALDGTEKMMRVAYLMSPLSSSDEAYSATTREQLVYVDENKVLVNNEGMLVELVEDEDDNISAQYVTEVEEDGSEYMIQVNNNGEVIKRILVEVSTESAN